jgi:hypothetical protein
MLIEAAIGAGIVLLKLVEGNTSALRAGYVGGHLVNTLLLVAAMTTTVWAARARSGGVTRRRATGFTVAMATMLLVAATGWATRSFPARRWPRDWPLISIPRRTS